MGDAGTILFNPVFSPASRLTPPKDRHDEHGSIGSDASIRSIGAAGSILSVGSAGSILSVGSSGSLLSIGSAGSILSIGSIGSVLSIGSAGSIASIGSALSIGAVGGWCERRTRVVEAGATLLALGAVAAAALER